MKRLFIPGLVLVFLTACVVRLYRVTAPVADWHSFRQVDTASVARMYVQNGIDLMHPRYHDLSNIQSGKDNPQGWRMVEFPLYQGIAAVLTRGIGTFPAEVWLRLVTIAASAASAVLIVLLGAAFVGSGAGFAAGFLYALLPYSVYYGRVILPEPLAVFFALLSIYAVVKKSHAKTKPPSDIWFVVSAASGAAALLVKPTAAFILLPVPYLLFRAYGFTRAFTVRCLVYAGIALTPFLWWRQYIQAYPEGIPASDWLWNKNGIRLKGAWFYWLFSQRIGSLILGYWGLILLGTGLMLPVKKDSWILHLFGLGALAYLVVFAGGNVQHDYYQIILLPVLCLYTGAGLWHIVTNRMLSRIAAIGTALVSIAFAVAFSWYTVRTYYWINRPEIIEAGAAANRLLPADAKVIAPYNGDTTFLYQTHRSGWPLGFDIDEKIAMGATAYVTVSPTDDDFETKTLAEKYTVLVRNDRFAIIDLTKPASP